MNYLIQRTLENRGISIDAFKARFNYDEETLQNIDELAVHLYDARQKGFEITALTDFDFDGITSGIIAYAGLSELGFKTNLFQPDVSRGYGFDIEDVERLMREYPKTKVVITADTGIGCVAGIDRLREMGIKVLVTDHHMQSVNINADCIVNPCQFDEAYKNKSICGAFVLYSCLKYYSEKYEHTRLVRDNIDRLIVFAGMGTISDTMVLQGCNIDTVNSSVAICRFLFNNGKDSIVRYIDGSNPYRCAFYGLHLLLCKMQQERKISTSLDINEDLIGFYIAPMFNCIKRLSMSTLDAYNVFFGCEPVKYIDNLWEANKERRRLVDEYLEKMLADDQPLAPIVYFSDAPGGILGLLATRVISKSDMPAIVLNRGSDGRIHGSGRCPQWYPFWDKTATYEDGVEGGGHNPAFGVRFNDDKAVEKLHAFLLTSINATLADMMAEMAEDDGLSEYDFEIASESIDSDLSDCKTGEFELLSEYTRTINKLRPFGNGFASPSIKLNVKYKDALFMTLGTDKQHAKLLLSDGMVVILWNAADTIFPEDVLYDDVIEFGPNGEQIVTDRQRVSVSMDGNDFENPDKELEVIGSLNTNRYFDIVTLQFLGDLK